MQVQACARPASGSQFRVGIEGEGRQQAELEPLPCVQESAYSRVAGRQDAECAKPATALLLQPLEIKQPGTAPLQPAG